MSSPDLIVRVAIPSPLRRVFDYRLPLATPAPQPGCRVVVSFGRRQCHGLVLALSPHSALAPERLKSVQQVTDSAPLLPARLLKLLQWAADYYQHPVGEVMLGALPALLREGRLPHAAGETVWVLTAAGQTASDAELARAPRQATLLAMLRAHAAGLTAAAIDAGHTNWRAAMRSLVRKGWVAAHTRSCLQSGGDARPVPAATLNAAQARAVAAVAAGLGAFQVSLLDGVTGSGKTEVYLTLIDQVLARGEQVLVLVPEIGLTPQLLARFRGRFATPIAVLHSGLSDSERLCAWLAARDGGAAIVIGTRSAVFTPLARPGLFVLDEEHDISFKQQEGFRYSARDVAIKRAQLEQVPVLLGSATPALETLYNVQQGRYAHLQLPERAGATAHPTIDVLDVRKQPMQHGLSAALLNAMRRHLEGGGQVLLFLNRRGYAPALLCHECGWVAPCRRCDAKMTLFYQHGSPRLRCHHCGAERTPEPQCPQCRGAELIPVGAGTERLEETLRRLFPAIGIARIDRDTTRRKGALETLLEEVHDGSRRILIGTQMLAKGHHFPAVTLVGLVDVDQGLLSADYRATERMAQLIVQVAGRAGRAERPGQVLIQTHHPEHPLLRVLLTQGYGAFARAALEERRQAQLPPYTYQALLRAEAPDGQSPLAFLSRARDLAQDHNPGRVLILGPVPAPMERRAGRVRARLLLQAGSRAALQRLLTPWLLRLEQEQLGRTVRWSIDVDPQETY